MQKKDFERRDGDGGAASPRVQSHCLSVIGARRGKFSRSTSNWRLSLHVSGLGSSFVAFQCAVDLLGGWTAVAVQEKVQLLQREKGKRDQAVKTWTLREARQPQKLMRDSDQSIVKSKACCEHDRA